MIDESKKGRQSKFNLYMTLYTVLRVLTLITGLDLYLGLYMLGAYWLSIG